LLLDLLMLRGVMLFPQTSADDSVIVLSSLP
jgi:hypothetical protein